MKTKRRIPCGVISRALFTVSALAVGSALADAWTDPDTGYKWNYRILGDVAEIYKSNSEAISPQPTGTVAIPASLGGKPVTSLGASAFKGCCELVGVAIPASVTNIGASAFSGCSGLVGVVVPDGVTRIGGSAFLGCSGLASVVIPPSVTNIGSSAFKGCRALTKLEIPNGVTNIGASAFSGCSGLVDVVVPDGVTRIGGSAFLGCGGLASVVIPPSVTSIGASAFKDCDRLTRVVVPQCVCVRKLSSVFPSSYQSITDVVVSSDVASLAAAMFKDCSRLADVVFEGDAPKLGKDVFAGVRADCTVHVGRYSIGWGVAIPGTWEGLRIEYSGAIEPKASSLWPLGVEGAVPAAAASVYDGCLYDRVGAVAGTIQVKVGKPNARTRLSAVKARVVDRDGRKKNLRAAGNGTTLLSVDGPTTVLCGGICVVTLGAQGMCGRYGNYTIDGARNVFVSKDSGDKAVASAALGKWQGAVCVAWEGEQGWNALSVATAAKGKAKVGGMLADGTKVSAKSQLVVGEEWCCVPVVYVKKGAKLAFNVWLPKAATSAALPGVEGIANAVVGKPGTLKAGARFNLDAVMGDAKYANYLPDGVSVGGGAKWTLPKAGKVVYRRGTIEVDATKLGENPSALKLTYKAKDGKFKGSFKAYADVNGKPKATSVKVTGVLVNGTGYGTAAAKGANAPVTIK